ncbi:hypothetical protein P280DRAFT_398147, partial [Massarina eburnea CBS 473.64]
IYYYFSKNITYDHRIMSTELPVRSAVLKHDTGGLVVRWVTTGEYLLLYVFALFGVLFFEISADYVSNAENKYLDYKLTVRPLDSDVLCRYRSRWARGRLYFITRYCLPTRFLDVKHSSSFRSIAYAAVGKLRRYVTDINWLHGSYCALARPNIFDQS